MNQVTLYTQARLGHPGPQLHARARGTREKDVYSLLEYSEWSCELDTWQERLGHERATVPGIGRKFYRWRCTENLYIGVFYSTSTLRVCFTGSL